jgi:dihydroorotase
MNILIKSARIIDPNSPHNNTVKDILIKNGIVSKIENEIIDSVTQVISYENLHISPGLFDMRSNLREPGHEQHETIESGLKAAEKGGFTGIAVMPSTTPIADNRGVIENIIQKSNTSSIDVHPIGAVSQKLEGKELAEMFDMKSGGAIAFSDAEKSIKSANLMSRALLYSKNFGGLVMNSPNDATISGHGQMHEGVESTKLGLEGIAALAEELMVSRDLFLANYNDTKIHIGPISCSNSVAMIKDAKENGIKVSCDIAAHQLHFLDADLNTFDTHLKVNPPFRSQQHKDDLIDALKNNIIDVISSDHSPWDVEEKQKEFDLAKFGISTLETTFSTALSNLIDIIGLESIIAKLSINPRSILQLEIPILKEGFEANFTLYNPTKKWTPSANDWASKSKNSPFFGKELTGVVYQTLKH